MSDAEIPILTQPEVSLDKTPSTSVKPLAAPTEELSHPPLVPTQERDPNNASPTNQPPHNRPRINERWIVNPKFKRNTGCPSFQ